MAYDLKSFYASVDELTTRDRSIAVLYGRLPDTEGGGLIPIGVDMSGNLQIGTDITLNVSEITPVNVIQPDATLLQATVQGSVDAIQSGTWDINDINGTISLPTGAATVTAQNSQTTLLANIASDLSNLGSSGTPVSAYGDSVALASGASVTLVTYTVSTGTNFIIGSASGSGETVGVYTLAVNGSNVAVKRSCYAGFDVDFQCGAGVTTALGDVITLTVQNSGAAPATFNGTIYGRLN